MDFETISVWIDKREFKLKVAETAEQRRQGLAGRTNLDADGMLFKYDYPVYRPFYMRHTFLPLVIAFFNEYGAFIGWEKLKPLDETPVLPPKPFRYAVEFPVGKEPVMPPVALTFSQ